jgi:hypothetical protein
VVIVVQLICEVLKSAACVSSIDMSVLQCRHSPQGFSVGSSSRLPRYSEVIGSQSCIYSRHRNVLKNLGHIFMPEKVVIAYFKNAIRYVFYK